MRSDYKALIVDARKVAHAPSRYPAWVLRGLLTDLADALEAHQVVTQ